MAVAKAGSHKELAGPPKNKEFRAAVALTNETNILAGG